MIAQIRLSGRLHGDLLHDFGFLTILEEPNGIQTFVPLRGDAIHFDPVSECLGLGKNSREAPSQLTNSNPDQDIPSPATTYLPAEMHLVLTLTISICYP